MLNSFQFLDTFNGFLIILSEFKQFFFTFQLKRRKPCLVFRKKGRSLKNTKNVIKICIYSEATKIHIFLNVIKTF